MGSSLPLQGGTVLAKTVSESHSLPSHGFAVGDVIRYDVTQSRWVKAQANNAANAEVAGVVSAVPSTSSFTLVYSGYIDLPAAFSGISFPALFLSDSLPGGLTASPPSAIGSVVKPVAIRSNNGVGHIVVNYLGTQIGGSSTVSIDQIQPVGTVMPYGGSVIPDTWLECNGVSYAISDYTELYDRTLYPSGERVPMYGYVVTLTGTNVSANIDVNDIIQFKNNTASWSGGLYDSNAELIGVVLNRTATTAVVQTLPVYNSTTKTFSNPNVTFKSGNGTGTLNGGSQYRFFTSGGAVKGGGGSVSFSGTSITHFNTPDMRGRFALGTNTNAIGELESDTGYFSAISGVYPLASEGGQESTIANSGLNTSSPSVWGSVSTINGGPIANMPPYLAVRYIIKAKPYTRAAIIDETEINYPNLLVTDLRSGLMRGAGVGEDLVFKTNTGNTTTGTERMRLKNSGNLCIGADTNAAKLFVRGGDDDAMPEIQIAGTNNTIQFHASIGAGNWNPLNTNGMQSIVYAKTNGGDQPVKLSIVPWTSAANSGMVLDSTTTRTYVGLGTNSPTAKLEIFGTNGEQSEVRITSTTANSGGRLTLYENAQGAHGIISQGANRNLTIQDLFYQVPMVSINNANNGGARVGIGTTTPTTTLDVNGSVVFSGNLYTTAGRIGVGTSAPTVALDVAGASRFTGTLTIAGATTTAPIVCTVAPTLGSHLATKSYVDSREYIFTYGQLNNETFSGYTNNYQAPIWGTLHNNSNFSDVFPPTGKTIANLVAFIPSINQIHFAGGVDGNDSMRCMYSVLSDRIRIWTQNSEQRRAASVNYLAVWR